jgi:Mrp family chromosome partitioning ATPase
MSEARSAAGPGADPNWAGQAVKAAVVECVRVRTAAELDQRAAILRDPLSARAASFRVLRHRLADRGDPKVLVVTSAEDGEGKTTCALNLACALAESGRNRVLLLEVNTGRPAVAGLLGFLPPGCFFEQLAQHRTEPTRPWTVAQVAPHDVDVLAVQPRPEPRPPLHGPSLLAAIASLRAAYAYTVIDTSSILTGLDVPLLEDAADGIVIAARARHTRGRALTAALEQAGASRVLGVVLVDV